MTKPKPYAAILPTILCQQPAVILHWLTTERASGNLSVEIVLDVLIELASRQTTPTQPQTFHELVNTHNVMATQLEIYKHAVKAMLPLIPAEIACRYMVSGKRIAELRRVKMFAELLDALAAVDKLEGVE